MGETRSRVRNAVVRVIRDAGIPLTAKQVVGRIGTVAAQVDVRAEIRHLVDKGVLYATTGGRHWDHDEEEVFFVKAKELVEERPLSRTDLARALGRLGTGASETWRRQFYARLKREPWVFVWPAHGRQRSERISSKPPDLEVYLGAIAREYQAISSKLEQVGMDRIEMARHVVGDDLVSEPARIQPVVEPPAEPPPEVAPVRDPEPEPERAKPQLVRQLLAPSSEGDREFQKEMALELVFAWQDAVEDPTRESLSRVLVNMGAQRLGRVGEEAPFDGTVHSTEDDLFPDEPARIVEPGWQLERGGVMRVLAKAKVVDAEESP